MLSPSVVWSIPTPPDRRRLVRAWAALVVVYLAAMVALQGFNGDATLAAVAYAMQGHEWALRHHWLTEGWVHGGGKRLVAGAFLALTI